jgi:type I restriction enzyme, S subunit
MNSEWQTVNIASLCTGIYDGPHATPKKIDHGPIFLGISSLNKGQLDLSSLEYLSEEDYPKWTKRVVPQKGDIVFSYETRLGEVAIIPNGLRCCLGRRMALMRIDQSKAIPEYILYAYLSPAFQKVIRERTIHGSTVDRIPLTEFGSFPISIPPLSVQKEIAETLSAIDDRITLLRETNTTLEAIAQALFKSWFVNFDPVRAKQEGREPEGMDADTAALFPGSFEESELGLVPKGWRAGTLNDLAVYQNGYAFKTKDWQETGYPVVKIGNVKPGVIDISGCSWVSDDVISGLDRFLLKRGDLLVGMTGYVGETGLVPDLSPPAYLNQRVGRISTKAGIADLGFVYCVVRNPQYKFYAEERSHGSAQANVSGSDLMAYPAIIPTSEVLCAFNQTLHSLINKILTNHSQAQTLATLRDTLLPRLISGRLRLPDAEALVEDV